MEILKGRMVDDGGCSLNPPVNTTVSGQPEPFQDQTGAWMEEFESADEARATGGRGSSDNDGEGFLKWPTGCGESMGVQDAVASPG